MMTPTRSKSFERQGSRDYNHNTGQRLSQGAKSDNNSKNISTFADPTFHIPPPAKRAVGLFRLWDI